MVILMLISCVGWVCTTDPHTINVMLYCLSYSRKLYRQIPSSVSRSPAYVLDDATLLVDDLTTNFVKWIVSSLPCTSVLGWPTKIRTQTKGARILCATVTPQAKMLVLFTSEPVCLECSTIKYLLCLVKYPVYYFPLIYSLQYPQQR